MQNPTTAYEFFTNAAFHSGQHWWQCDPEGIRQTQGCPCMQAAKYFNPAITCAEFVEMWYDTPIISQLQTLATDFETNADSRADFTQTLIEFITYSNNIYMMKIRMPSAHEVQQLAIMLKSHSG